MMYTFAVLFKELFVDAWSFEGLDKLEVNRANMRFGVHEGEGRRFAAQYGAVEQGRLCHINIPGSPAQRLVVDLYHFFYVADDYANLGDGNALEASHFMCHVSISLSFVETRFVVFTG